MRRVLIRLTLIVKTIGALAVGAVTLGAMVPSAAFAETDEKMWAALKAGNHVVLLRHTATVPGIGDPPGYRLDDCRTQRNLSEAGREQARVWGRVFAEKGIAVGGVFSSAWCRCVDTAVLAFGKADTWPALNSHFETPSSAALQAEQVRGGVGVRMVRGKNLVLVTHQVNITELTGRTIAMGEAVIAKFEERSVQRGEPARLIAIGTLKVQ